MRGWKASAVAAVGAVVLLWFFGAFSSPERSNRTSEAPDAGRSEQHTPRTDGSSSEDGRNTVSAPAVLRGLVRGPESPVWGAVVRVLTRDPEPRTLAVGSTNTDGRFEFKVAAEDLPLSFDLLVVAEKLRPVIERELSLAGGETRDTEFVLDVGEVLSLRPRDPWGGVVTLSKLRVEPIEDETGRALTRIERESAVRFPAGWAADPVFPGLLDVPHELYFSLPGWRWVNAASLRPGTDPVPIVLEPFVEANVDVLDFETLKPVGPLTARLTLPEVGGKLLYEGSHTDAIRFRRAFTKEAWNGPRGLTDLPELRLEVSAPGYGKHVGAASVGRSAHKILGGVFLVRTRDVNFRFRIHGSADGLPTSLAATVYGHGPSRRTTMSLRGTGEIGVYEGGLPAGRCTIAIESRQHVPARLYTRDHTIGDGAVTEASVELPVPARMTFRRPPGGGEWKIYGRVRTVVDPAGPARSRARRESRLRLHLRQPATDVWVRVFGKWRFTFRHNGKIHGITRRPILVGAGEHRVVSWPTRRR